jgi:purine-nucleoside phosphorylase
VIVDRAWAERNLGFDPIGTPAPALTFAFSPAAKPSASIEDYEREIIDFDSEAPQGMAFLAFTNTTGLSRFTEIPWEKGLAPKTDRQARTGQGGRLPPADVLVVTWTVDEGHALSRVLTPSKDSRNDYRSYTHNYATISKKMRKGCPAVEAKRLGAYWTAKIGGKTVVVFKSDSHLSQDTPKVLKDTPKLLKKYGTLPNQDVWKQIIQEVNPKLVITTGTAGGIGKQFEVGDVVVSPIVQFDCTKWLKVKPYLGAHYQDGTPNTKYFAKAKALLKYNSAQLPKDNTRQPRIVQTSGLSSSVVTTDFFGFDTSKNTFGLQGLGDASEMGDAVLGMVTSQMGSEAPRWVAVRNVSDPQIKSQGTIKDQAALASQIYKGYGRWSSVCSAIICWALIAAEK